MWLHYSSIASLTTSDRGAKLAGSRRHSFSVVHSNVRSSRAYTPHDAAFSPLHASTSLAVTEELAPILSSSDNATANKADSSDGKLAMDDSETSHGNLAMDETELINSLAAKLQDFSRSQDLAAGEEMHSHIVICGLDSDRYLANLLVLMYGSCGSIEEAEAVFHKIASPNIYSANMMINAYVSSYELENATAFFDDMSQRNGASWNAIISALAKNGFGKDALKYYHGMLEEGFQPNVITCVSAIDACAGVVALSEGMRLHSAVVTYGFYNIIVATALINLYGQCGDLESARDVFHRVPQHDLLSWSAMIGACVNNGCNEEALVMFDEMPNRGLHPSRSTYMSILSACGNLTALSKGYKLHAEMVSTNSEIFVIVGNALINMYGRCQSLQDSAVMFHRMSQRDIITWTTMISAYSLSGKNEEAIELFYQMQIDGAIPNNLTISIIFDVCTSMEALEEGQYVYKYSVCIGIELDFIAAIALINMYGKCCSLEDAMAVFRSFEEHGVLLWNAIIAAYATNGKDKEAWVLVEEMQSKGVKPSKATFKIIEDMEPRELIQVRC